MANKKTLITETGFTIALGEEKIELPFTLEALIRMCKYPGSIAGLSENIHQLNLEAYVYLISGAAGMTETQIKALPEKIFAAGVIDLKMPLMMYLLRLARGGRPANDKDAEDKAPEGNG